MLSTAIGSLHDSFDRVAHVGDQIGVENQLGFDRSRKSARRDFNRKRGVAKEDGTGLGKALLAVSMDSEFLFDGVAIVCRGTVESAKALLGVLRGHCGAEGKSLLGVVSGGNVELDRARGEGLGPRLCGPVERDRLRLIEIIAHGHRQMDFVANGEDFRRFELSEEGKKSADVCRTRGDMSI